MAPSKNSGPFVTFVKWLDANERRSLRELVALDRLDKARGRSDVHALIKGLRSKHASVRFAAAEALRDRPDPRAAGALIAVVEDQPHASDAIEALGEVRDPVAVPVLAKALAAGGSLTAVRALGQMGGPEATSALVDYLAAGGRYALVGLAIAESPVEVVAELLDDRWDPGFAASLVSIAASQSSSSPALGWIGHKPMAGQPIARLAAGLLDHFWDDGAADAVRKYLHHSVRAFITGTIVDPDTDWNERGDERERRHEREREHAVALVRLLPARTLPVLDAIADEWQGELGGVAH